MKNFKLIALFCLMAGLAKSQPYGELTYPHTGGSTISSGTITNMNAIAGFLMAGYRPTSIATTDNFFIDQVDQNGGFTMSGTFSSGYKIRKPTTNNCNTALTNVNNCIGVTVIETPTASAPSGEAYALAGTFASGTGGIFFSCLKSNGAPIAPVYYNFVNAATASSISKPLLALAPNVSGLSYMYYYICGSYATSAGMQYMYVLVVDQTGAIAYQNEFNIPSFLGMNGIVRPSAIIESSLLNGDLVIVGRAYDPTTMLSGSTRGFYMEMTPGTAVPVVFDLFGETLPTSAIEAFTSITNEANLTGNYIIGGSSDFVAGYPDWFVRMANGGTATWSNFIATSNGDNTGGPVGVVSARITPVVPPNITVNYGVSYSPTRGMVTMKLTDLGVPFVGSLLTLDNTFFNTAPSQISRPLNITAKSNASFNEGIHIFGNDNVTTTNSHYLTLSYFNGQEACLPTRDNGMMSTPGPLTAIPNSITGNNTPGYAICTNFALLQSVLTPVKNSSCPPTNPVTGGTNNKLNTATGITETTLSNDNLNLAPNPTTGKITINYNTEDNGKVQFTLYNGLGQLVKQVYTAQDTGGEHSLELDFNSLGIEAGIYFLNAELDGTRTTQKIIYTKN